MNSSKKTAFRDWLEEKRVAEELFYRRIELVLELDAISWTRRQFSVIDWSWSEEHYWIIWLMQKAFQSILLNDIRRTFQKKGILEEKYFRKFAL